MRAVILSVTLGASLATANIIFNHIPLSCDASVAGYTGCLRGQHCSQDGTCETSYGDLYPLSFRSVDVGRRDLSVDGRCGPMNGGLQCDPNATGYQGTCCSQYGWCGNTSAYCGTGCTAGCDGAAPTQPGGGGTDPRSDGRCGAAFGGATCDPTSAVGGCCSAAGFCGNDDAHCLVSNGCQSGCSNGTAPRPDGQCGSAFGNAVCDPTTAVGGCCSAAGFCGNDDAHCLVSNGCQSGCSKVTSPSSSPTPSGGSGTSPRPDGRCGAAFGGATCDPTSAVGGCCSAAGWCGNTDAHCLVTNGCQSGCAGGGSGGTPPSGPAGPGTVVQSKPPSSTTTGEPVLGQASPTAAPTGGGFTADGTCGQSNGGTECGNWPQGACCSMYGFCGNTTAHCGDGCQSGPCSGGAVVPAPGPSPAPGNQNGGSFKTVGQSGVPAMHAALLPNGRLTFLDKVENYTQLKLSDGQYAYSSEYDPIANSAVGLAYKTNSFCAGGALLADGRVVALGGNAPLPDIDPTVGDGFTGIRYLARSSTDASLDGQSWSEPGNKLASARWYPTAQVLGDGSVFVASGSLNGLDPRVLANNNPTWELLNAEAVSSGVNVPMDILAKNQPYYMYPFIHLLQDGTLFVFVSKSSEIFNVGTNTTVKPLPDLPGDYRTYPNTGGSVMLPLSSATQWNPDIVICGGGAYQDITSPTDPSCGRIQPLSNNPQWELDSMPEGRCMVEGTLLPDGTVIWLNGADRGAQGFGLATDPAYEVLIYDPTKPLGQRFTTGPSSTIARLYHSVATLLLDGTLLVTGSNPVEQPILTPDAANPYMTEFRVEIYTPPYLSGDNANRRPGNVVLSSTTLHADGSQFTITFGNPTGAQGVQIVLYQGGFVTHSLHMGHRMAYLDNTGFSTTSTTQTVTATMPPNTNIAPPGPYVIYVVVDGVPAIGQFVQVSA